MMRLIRDLPAYGKIVSMMVQTVLIYRANVLFSLGSVLLQIYLLRVVWTAVYAGRPSVEGIDLSTLVPYVTLATLQAALLNPEIAMHLRERVREGKVALDLARPAPFLGQMMAMQVGDTAGLLPFLALALPFAAILGDLVPPASTSAALLYAASLALAYLIMLLIGLLLGLMAFWTVEVWGFLAIYRHVSRFFAGALIPFWFFPPALRAVAEVLPFQTQAFIPISIYLGQTTRQEAVTAIALQATWVATLAGLILIGWYFTRQRIIIQGG